MRGNGSNQNKDGYMKLIEQFSKREFEKEKGKNPAPEIGESKTDLSVGCPINAVA